MDFPQLYLPCYYTLIGCGLDSIIVWFNRHKKFPRLLEQNCIEDEVTDTAVLINESKDIDELVVVFGGEHV